MGRVVFKSGEICLQNREGCLLKWDELSSKSEASYLGARFMWGELSLGRVVLIPLTILHQGGAPGGKLVPGSHKRCELGHTVIRHFSRGDQRNREVIPVYGKKLLLYASLLAEGKSQRVLISTTPIIRDKVICGYSGFTL